MVYYFSFSGITKLQKGPGLWHTICYYILHSCQHSTWFSQSILSPFHLTSVSWEGVCIQLTHESQVTKITSPANTEMFLSLVSIPGRCSPAVLASWGALMATSHFVLNIVVPKFNFPSCNVFQWEHCSRAIVSKKVGGTTEKIPLSNSTSCSQKRCPSVLAKLIQSTSWWGLNHKI